MKLFTSLAVLATLIPATMAKDVLSLVVRVEEGSSLDELYCPAADTNKIEEYLFNRIVNDIELYAKEEGFFPEEESLDNEMEVTKLEDGRGHRVLVTDQRFLCGKKFCGNNPTAPCCSGGGGGCGFGCGGGGNDGGRKLAIEDFEKQVAETIADSIQEECEGPKLTIDIFINN